MESGRTAPCTIRAGQLTGQTRVTDTGSQTAILHAGPIEIACDWSNRAGLIQLAAAAMHALTIVDGNGRMEM
ncbi:hypothetical protein GCM10027294_45710 [Marinactinospora endophytica]